MFQNLTLFQTAADMAKHAGARQAVVARNIANADTPGFEAQKIAPFGDVYRSGSSTQMRATRADHFGAAMAAPNAMPRDGGTEPAPNGNTVSIEDEMMDAVAIAREHSRALAIYRHTMTVLRTTIGR